MSMTDPATAGHESPIPRREPVLVRVLPAASRGPVPGWQSVRGGGRLPDESNRLSLMPATRSGLTLIELLVVVIIMTMLVATTIPLMAPSVEQRRIREAARGVSAFLSGARARAIKTGRPVGVMIQRMDNEWGAARALFVAEEAPPFGGYAEPSLVQVMPLSAGNPPIVRATFGEAIPRGFLWPGDKLKVNYQGHVYEFLSRADVDSLGLPAPDNGLNGQEPENRSFSPSSSFVLRRSGVTGLLPWPVGVTSPGLPYQILRQPGRWGHTARTAAPPYELPDGVVIDLYGSGFDEDRFGDANIDPIVFTFSPNGGLHRVHHNHGTETNPDFVNERATAAIHLLIGKREKVPPTLPATDENQNWLDLTNLWVSIGQQTGQVSTSETASVLSTTATGSARVTAGAVTNVTVANPGSGYTAPPAVILVGDGKGALATASLNGDRVDHVGIAHPGEGYGTPPVVIFADLFQARRFAAEMHTMGGN